MEKLFTVQIAPHPDKDALGIMPSTYVVAESMEQAILQVQSKLVEPYYIEQCSQIAPNHFANLILVENHAPV
jgi:hypothetical protein